MKPLVGALPFHEVRLSQVRHYRCPRGWNWAATIPDYDLWILLQGKGMLLIDGRNLPVTAPQAVLFRPGERISGTHDPMAPLEVIAIHFTPRSVSRNLRWDDHLRSVGLRFSGFFREAGERLVDEHARGDAGGRQAAEALTMSILAIVWRLALCPCEQGGDDRIEKLVRLVQREPERLWTVPVLARHAGMGATRLNRAFHALTGGAPMAWVIRCRLARAAWLLQETNMKLAEIADACGYRDAYFFSRQFRRFMGCPPGAWRRASGSR